jgi:hypothetical protein
LENKGGGGLGGRVPGEKFSLNVEKNNGPVLTNSASSSNLLLREFVQKWKRSEEVV